jgi:hypothetical protein
LAILAWLKGGEDFATFVEPAMKWLATKCKDGVFGDTQSTILALKAIVEYDKTRSAAGPGNVEVILDGKVISKVWQAFLVLTPQGKIRPQVQPNCGASFFC